MDSLIKEHRAMTFEHIIREINSGVIRLPHFQRNFDWGLENAAYLFDSIFKSIPIGNAVLWQTDFIMNEERTIGGYDTPEREGSRSYILDGQQRITSTFSTLLGLETGGKDFKQLHVDLNVDPNDFSFEDIVQVIKTNTVPGNLFPIYKLWSDNAEEYLEEIDSRQQRTNARKYITLLKTSKFEVEVMTTNIVPIAVSIFHAINMGGIKLSTADVMGCILFDSEKGWYFHKETDILQAETKQRNFELGKEEQLRLASLLIFGKNDQKSIFRLKTEYVVENWPQIKRALFLAIDFLKSHYGLKGKNDLFNGSIIHLTTLFFYKNNLRNPSTLQKKKLDAFFIDSGANQRYARGTGEQIKKDALVIEKIVRNEPIIANLEMIRYRSEEEQKDILKAGYFKKLNSLKNFQRFVYLALAMKDPKSFATGIRVLSDTTEQPNQLHKHHVFPKSTYGTNADNIFNIMLLDAETNQHIGNNKPIDYLKEYEQNENFKQIMESHFIGVDELNDIANDDLEAFKRHRMVKMMTFMDGYFS